MWVTLERKIAGTGDVIWVQQMRKTGRTLIGGVWEDNANEVGGREKEH